MKNIISRVRDLPYAVLAFVTVEAMNSAPAMAQSANGGKLGDIANGVTGQISNMGKLVVGGGFLAGVGFVATGLSKLKAAAESNGNIKYSEGLWRMGVGAGLVAIPAVTGSLTQTANLGGANITNYNGF